ncbi:MAG: restriction endonuclease, partial [Rhodoferax sp.]|nr:restriction endonuclease [Rhodoferax sp.]
MARSRSNKRQKRAVNKLQETGFRLCALGLGFLIIPWFIGSSPMLTVVAAGLRTPGWLALAAGVVLLGIHQLTQAKVANNNPLPQLTPRAPTPTERTVLRDIRDDIAAHRRAPGAAAAPTRQVATYWSPAVFAAIEWRRFEAVCEALFAQAGFETR